MEERVKVIRLNEKGDKSRKLADTFGVGKTQINNIIANKENIMKAWTSGELNSQRKILEPRRQLYPEINERVWQWFTTQRAKNMPITGKLIQDRAEILALELGMFVVYFSS